MRPDSLQVAKLRLFVVIITLSLIELINVQIFMKCDALKVSVLKLT